MGVRAQLYEIPASIFVDIKAGGDIDEQILKNAPVIFLDKSWHELHSLFRNMEAPLNRIISGDWAYPSSSQTIEAFVEGKGAGYYVAFASPLLVHEIATALPALSESELLRIANETNITLDDYCRSHLKELKEAYFNAAKNGNAISITVA